MELLEALRIIRNQKKIVIPLLIIAFIAAGIMVARMDTTYQSEGTVTLLNSNLKSTDNPYLSFDQSLQTTAEVLGDAVSSSDTRNSYEKKGLSSNYDVSVPYDPTKTILLPELSITATASSPAVATSTRNALLNDIKDDLEQKQTEAGAPRDSWIQAFAVSNNNVIAGSGSKARTFLIVFGLGTAFAIVLAFIVDGFKRGVRNPRKGAVINVEAPPTENEKQETPAAQPVRSSRGKRKPGSGKKAHTTPNKSSSTSDSSLTH